jgi:hypothetical protein
MVGPTASSFVFPRQELAARLQALRLSGRGDDDRQMPLTCLGSMIGVSREAVNQAANGEMPGVTQIRLSFVLQRIESGELAYKCWGGGWEIAQDPKPPQPVQQPKKLLIRFQRGAPDLRCFPQIRVFGPRGDIFRWR